jgi:amino-acid N-acetyltransferase
MSMEVQFAVRKARPADAAGIAALLAEYAEKGVLLPRPLEDILESIRDFFVAEVQNGGAADEQGAQGCAALRIYDDQLAEIRSIAVLPHLIRHGLGRQLLAACEEDARVYGVKKIFALTYVPEFFERNGYVRVQKEELPQKIWRDCFRCKKFPNCREIAIIKAIDSR